MPVCPDGTSAGSVSPGTGCLISASARCCCPSDPTWLRESCHNQFGAYTTDTIYRGIPHPETGLAPEQIVAAFHTSLTMLSAEIEGRSFGGGVLELVPSEIARLAIIDPGTAVDWIDQLDGIQRTSGHEALVKAADKRLVHAGVLDVDHLAVLKGAYESLLTRRLARNRAKAGPRNTRHKAA